MASRDDHNVMNTARTSAVPLCAVVVLAAAMAAAWIAAGSTALLGHPLRHALTWVALMAAVVAGWPRGDLRLRPWCALAGAVMVGFVMTASTLPAVNVLAVTLVTAALVRSQASLRGRVILIATLATAVLAVFRLACDSIPAVWIWADSLGRAFGKFAGLITGQPLWVGASFGGVDFLVLMTALYIGWLICTAPPRRARAIYAAAAILLGHLIYLVALAYSTRLLATLPEVVVPEVTGINRVGIWTWGNALRTLLPWNLPLLAVIIQIAIAVAMFRWATWLPIAEEDTKKDEPETGLALLADMLVKFGPLTLAALIPVLTVLGLSKSDLTDKTVVVHEQGYLELSKPEYDGQSGEPYGMLRLFVESLGGNFATSRDLSDLDDADVLVLLHPDRPWDEKSLDRIWDFVYYGGSLLLVADPRVQQGDSRSSFNDVLKRVARELRVRDDTAIAQTQSWEHSLTALAHPATAGIDDRRNRFGLAMGSSIDVRWPARAMLVGRWGWGDPPSEAIMTGVYQYDAGEKLGDLVLAAEERFGEGKIIVLSDSACLDNEVHADSYTFTGRVLGYLAAKTASPQDGWRQLLGLLAMAAVIGLLAAEVTAVRLALVAVTLAFSLTYCTALSHWTARVLPDGRAGTPNHVAYIDASHLEAYSSEPWHRFGIAGFSRTLMRSGYLPLLLPELTAERLERAGLLISIAPARKFSPAELQAVRAFVESGGTFICMIGAEEAAAGRELLADFDFHVPHSPVLPADDAYEPEPLGALYSRYLALGDYDTYMQLYAGWPIECEARDAEVLKRGSDNVPVIIRRPLGRGNVVFIGDTYLATNQNLETLDNLRTDNLKFWRWLLTRVTDREVWIPPPPGAGSKAVADQVDPEPENEEVAP